MGLPPPGELPLRPLLESLSPGNFTLFFLAGEKGGLDKGPPHYEAR